MAIVDVLRSAQFVVNEQGQRTAALLDISAWEVLVDWVESATDIKIATYALTELERTGGRPALAGWLDWDAIREEWDEKAKSEK